MKDRERCYSFILSRTPHKTDKENNLKEIYQKIKRKSASEDIHSYLSRFIPEGVAEASQILFQDTQILPK
jgi:hypothetical protein